jgi:hypothetical protein
MKSTSLFANERVLGNPGTVAGGAADSASKFKTGLSRINQELWLVLSRLSEGAAPFALSYASP